MTTTFNDKNSVIVYVIITLLLMYRDNRRDWKNFLLYRLYIYTMTMLSNVNETMLNRYLSIQNLYDIFCILVIMFACSKDKVTRDFIRLVL